MKISELEEILREMAVNDLTEGSDIDDHPCMVAIRAIDKAFNVGYSLGFDQNADIDKKALHLDKFKKLSEV